MADSSVKQKRARRQPPCTILRTACGPCADCGDFQSSDLHSPTDGPITLRCGRCCPHCAKGWPAETARVTVGAQTTSEVSATARRAGGGLGYRSCEERS